MDLIEKLNSVLDYIEDNLKEQIDLDDLSKITHLSYYHFTRVFSALTGMGISEYIRNRRLSEAANEIIESDTKIIDIAFDYQYTTPESFSKAFKSFHKTSPKQARNLRSSLIYFPKLSFNITISGERSLTYRIFDAEETYYLGKSVRLNSNLRKFNDEKVFWKKFVDGNFYESIKTHMIDDCFIGVVYDIDPIKEEFSFMVGIKVNKGVKVEGFDNAEVPSARFAVFERTGPMPKALENFKSSIFTDWFPKTDYKIVPTAEIERYHKVDRNQEVTFEYWISIE
jgi:AraC family transcriptional regulator